MAHIEILGYEHIADIANNRFYAQAIRSIEYGPLSRFFAKHSTLPSELCHYVSGFDLIVSYLYDPDKIFEDNLRRSGARNIVIGPAKIKSGDHAARQLACPMEDLGIKILDFSPKIFPAAQDRQFAGNLLAKLARPIVAIHPGSGSKQKNWPIENWLTLIRKRLSAANFSGSVLIVAGEADTIDGLDELRRNDRCRFALNLPLPHLAALLEQTIFIGHDSGISHLAAAAGADCILLFGPTDPAIWAPPDERTSVIRGQNGQVANISVQEVERELACRLVKNGSGTDPHRH